MKNNNIQMVLHSVGNTIGSVKGRYIFAREKNYTKEKTDEYVEAEIHRQKIMKQLQTLVTKEESAPNQAMLDFIQKLGASDWSTEESLLAFFKDVYVPFTTPSTESATEVRNKLFRNPLK